LKLLRGVELKEYTSFRIGGRAEYFAEAADVLQLQNAYALCGGNAVILGGGSNVLISDRGIKGAVLRLRPGEIVLQDAAAVCYAGTSLSALARFYEKHGFSDFAWAAGIPGTVGGACIMNAGAFGCEIKDSLLWAEVLRKGEIIRLTHAACGFSYRASAFLPDDVVVRAAFGCTQGEPAEIAALRARYKAFRLSTQPSGFSAGSVFKAAICPQTQASKPAGWFIEKAGLKGARIGGAAVSQKHANFILNTDNAKASDVAALIRLVKAGVYAEFGVKLCEEIKFLGEF